MKKVFFLLWCVCLAFSVETTLAQALQLVNAFPGLSFTQPVFLTHSNDGSNRVFVVQQNGLIRVFSNDSASSTASTFLNITSKLSSTGGEEGLLGLAFDPDYSINGYFYVNYTVPNPLRTVVARYSVSQTNSNKADSLSGIVILEIDQPYGNHNGGMIMFGADGYLYIGTGDGGSGGDPLDNGQSRSVLLGKILRIDVSPVAINANYGIPPDNPFVGNSQGYREEIWAWGFRNPWRFSEDRATGQMWVGDVGQNNWEEVDLLAGGGNFGWRCYEGNVQYNSSGCGPSSDYIFPVKVYSHTGGDCSVSGGYVYRGYRRPDLIGQYIYADFCSGRIRKFQYANGTITGDSLLINAPFFISSFGVDQDGELYICNYSGGAIYRFVGNPLPITLGSFIAKLDQSGRGGVLLGWVTVSEINNYGFYVERRRDDEPDFVAVSGFIEGAGTTTEPQHYSYLDTTIIEGGLYCYRLRQIDLDGTVHNSWEVSITIDELSLITIVPRALQVSQNYPNPFNVSTVIRFSLPARLPSVSGERSWLEESRATSLVTLKVYNLLGQEVETLVSREMKPGNYEVTWDAGRAPSGVYFYRLQAGDLVATKKLVLLK